MSALKVDSLGLERLAKENCPKRSFLFSPQKQSNRKARQEDQEGRKWSMSKAVDVYLVVQLESAVLAVGYEPCASAARRGRVAT